MLSPRPFVPLKAAEPVFGCVQLCGMHKELQQTHLAHEAGMSEGVYNVGVAQVLSEGYLHGGPIRGALYVLVLLWRYDLHSQISQSAYSLIVKRKSSMLCSSHFCRVLPFLTT